VTGLTPLVNWPEVAILGVGATRGAGAGRVLPLNLGFDHRVIQGADAARFLAFLCALLSEPERLRETG
jgi:pyruvate dehydrogenase E2 component (dihydrolipoamide acetyltransferase)